MDEYPYEILENRVGGLEVKICGVNHGFFQEYEELYDELISNSMVVVSEFPPIKSYFENLYTLLGVKLADEERIEGWMRFFEGLANLCEKYKKKIFKVDPLTTVGHAIDTSIIPVASVSAGLALGGIIGSSIKKELGRREFLKYLGIMVGSAYLGIGTHYGTYYFRDPENERDRFLRAPTFGNNDSRNVRIAQGLEIIPEMLGNVEGDYILSLHSWQHTKAIDYYLTHRTIRRVKGLLYSATYNLVNDSFVRMYDVDEDGLWKEVGRRPY